MDYLVIELQDEPHIICTRDIMSDGKNLKPEVSKFNSGGNPYIFKDKYTAFRIADQCKQGLVYPIFDIMRTLENIKVKYGDTRYSASIKGILTMLDEII